MLKKTVDRSHPRDKLEEIVCRIVLVIQFTMRSVRAREHEEIGRKMPEYVRCRNQCDTLDCGLLVCMFGKCYAHTNPTVNPIGGINGEFDNVKSYHSKIAAKIMKGLPSES
ncbi:uncharacterized protein LOC127260076 [Andrographis paniculata]|uniref:uncharacterized protein LOC127260076 n=1 Tax=Andrographis paniculata TaxID=175694 RepID=UPI0021E6E2D9|nr:uncharacterized protein LOC127260076 [Andrographis paniculata]